MRSVEVVALFLASLGFSALSGLAEILGKRMLSNMLYLAAGALLGAAGTVWNWEKLCH